MFRAFTSPSSGLSSAVAYVLPLGSYNNIDSLNKIMLKYGVKIHIIQCQYYSIQEVTFSSCDARGILVD